ncbi:MAG: aldolase/citrate lyase family protein [Oscillospiraceae bacterium]|nr:aldolase/citrate lyase family protein [Oscillospiraceae bacterium]
MYNRPVDKLNEKIAKGEPVIGAHVYLADSSVTEMLGIMGNEFLWIDWEHSALDKSQIQSHLIAAKAAGIAAFVRIPWNDHVLAKPVLEMGPDGIVFPMIKTAEEARNAVAACTYPPKGARGFGPRRAVRYGMMPGGEYFEQVDSSFWKIMQIEHVEAVINLDEILKVEGVDTIVVGPNDLSGSIGLLGQLRHPEVMKLFDEIAEKCNKAGKPFGTSIGWNKQNVEDWKRRGASWIACGSDTGYIFEAGLGTLNGVKEIFGVK